MGKQMSKSLGRWEMGLLIGEEKNARVAGAEWETRDYGEMQLRASGCWRVPGSL